MKRKRKRKEKKGWLGGCTLGHTQMNGLVTLKVWFKGSRTTPLTKVTIEDGQITHVAKVL
jgi:hypothetical protein